MMAIALTLLTISLLVIGSVLSSATPANAALPPQQSGELKEAALFIITGVVQHISKEEVDVRAGTDYHYCATFLTEVIEASKIPTDCTSLPGIEMPAALPSAGNAIKIYYSQTGKRPEGWTGPSGQSAQLKAKAKARLYLTLQDGKLALLEPNGWEALHN